MLPTPSTSHVSYDEVYEPAEDSYLFLDTLSSATETAWLHERFAPASTEAEGDDFTTTTTEPKEDRRRQRRKATRRTPLLVEVGPGSGVIVAFATAHARVLFGSEVVSLAVDVNPRACVATRTTVERAVDETAETERSGRAKARQSMYLSSVRGDLTTSLRRNEVDILLFNPPYVPTESVPAPDPAPDPTTTTTTTTEGSTKAKLTFEESSHLLALSYAGGLDGMETTDRLLAQIPEILSARGVAYVLFCRANRPEDVKARISNWPSSTSPGDDLNTSQRQWRWRAETVGSSGKTAGWEKLEIVRIWREWE